MYALGCFGTWGVENKPVRDLGSARFHVDYIKTMPDFSKEHLAENFASEGALNDWTKVRPASQNLHHRSDEEVKMTGQQVASTNVQGHYTVSLHLPKAMGAIRDIISGET